MSERPDPAHDQEDADEDGIATELTVFVVLGAGFLAMFAGISWFWMVWVLGFAVVLPMVSILEDYFSGSSATEDLDEDERALERLKQRYADGEIDDEEFERRLGRLVENDSIDDVQHRLDREPTVQSGDRDHERNRDREQERDPDLEFEQ